MYFDYFDSPPNDNNPAYDPQVPHVYINGKLAYFQQNASILSKTVRENILFGMPYNQQKYNRIVEICCLHDDFKILTHGD